MLCRKTFFIFFAAAGLLLTTGGAKLIDTALFPKLDRPEVLSFLFHPRPAQHGRPVGKAIEYAVAVEKDVHIGCRFFIAEAAAPSILFFHGNGEIAADYDDIAPAYNRLGINFLAADYRGYGSSSGTPTASAMARDALVILTGIRKWRVQHKHIGPLFIMGRSLGSVSALELAARYPNDIQGVIIESGFAYTEPLLRFLGVRTKNLGITEEDGFGNYEKVSRCTKPLLVIHAQHDQFIPVSDAQALLKNCPAGRKQLIIIPGADHNSILRFAGPDYFTYIKDFIEGR